MSWPERETGFGAGSRRGGRRVPGVFLRSLLVLQIAAIAWLMVHFAFLTRGPLPFFRVVPGYNDLLLHALSFGLLALTFGLLIPLRIAGPLCAAAAAGIELTQLWLPSRSASLADFAAGLLGAGLGILAAALFRRTLRRRFETPRPAAGGRQETRA